MQMITNSKLKTVNTDFLVREVLFLNDISNNSNTYTIYILKKANFTTLEALDYISNYFGVCKENIGFAGLKDEDGVSEQYISIKEELDNKKIRQFNLLNKKDNNCFMELTKYGYQNRKLNIGELLGNQFKIIVRSLEMNLVETLLSNKKQSTIFINYYGTQRFGLPNAEKNTHIIGKHIIGKNYIKAIEMLSKQPNEIGMKASDFLENDRSNAEQFIESLDKNLIAFYQSSFYSYQWNENLMEEIKACTSNYYNFDDQGINYSFLKKNNFSKLPMFLPYIRVVHNNGKYQKLNLQRNTYVQLNIVASDVFKDIYHDEKWACEMNFFLPSGTYATVAVNQFISNLAQSSEMVCEMA